MSQNTDHSDTNHSEIAQNEISEHEQILETELEEMELEGGLDRIENAVNSILEDLDYQNFSALYDHYFRGHSHSEVAERLDLSSSDKAKEKIQEASEVLCDRLCRRLDIEKISREQTELIVKAAGARHRRDYSRIMEDRVSREDILTGQHKGSSEEREEAKEARTRKTVIKTTVETDEARGGPESTTGLQGFILLLSAITKRSIRAYRQRYKGRPGQTRSGGKGEKITVGDDEEIMQTARQLFEEEGPERVWFEGKGDLKGLRFSLRIDFGGDEEGVLVFSDFEAPGQGLSLPEDVAIHFTSDTGSETVFWDEGDGTVRVPTRKMSDHLEQGHQIRMSLSRR